MFSNTISKLFKKDNHCLKESIYKNRKTLYNNIPNIIQNSKTIHENKLQNQTSLFSDEGHKVSYLIQDKNIQNWSNDEVLSKEFESIGFYMSNHPLKEHEDSLKHYNVKTFKDFENGNDTESFVAGTVMSVKEKKTSKGSPFAIVKFSDLSKVYELFLFSEILSTNRDILIAGKSFLLTLVKDKLNQENRFRRINVRKILSLDKIINDSYDNVKIEVNSADSLEKLYEAIKEKGDSKIEICISDKNKNYSFELKNKRKFDYETLKYLNKEEYIKKISL